MGTTQTPGTLADGLSSLQDCRRHVDMRDSACKNEIAPRCERLKIGENPHGSRPGLRVKFDDGRPFHSPCINGFLTMPWYLRVESNSAMNSPLDQAHLPSSRRFACGGHSRPA